MARPVLAWLALLALLTSTCSDDRLARAGPGEPRLVERAVDGDTLLLEGGERVRLIGVDTPESVDPRRPVERYGKRAAEFTKGLVEGRRVRLESDRGTLARDRYGRTLAYVYLPDGRMLNLELLREGYAVAYTRFPFVRMAEFRSAEREARARGKGLWSGWSAEPGTASQPAAPAASPPAASAPGSCVARERCCRVCSSSRACGDSCIGLAQTCRSEPGCACDAATLCR